MKLGRQSVSIGQGAGRLQIRRLGDCLQLSSRSTSGSFLMRLISRIHHVSLIVADTDRALAFYRDLLGLEVDSTRPSLGYPGAWLKLGDQQIHLLELPNPDPVDARPAHGGRDRHLAMTVTDLGAVAELFDAAGIGYTRSRSGRPALFVRDPDANALELIEQR